MKLINTSFKLIDNTNSIKDQLIRSYKRLRAEGVVARMNVSKKVGSDIYSSDKPFVYNILQHPQSQWVNYNRRTANPLRFYFNGSLEMIQGILESEGLELKGIYTNKQFSKLNWFYIAEPVYLYYRSI